MPDLIPTLKRIREENLTILIPDLGLASYLSLAREIQIRLIALGILDPPDDGRFGPVSRLALGTFQNLAKLPPGAKIDARLADALLETDADELLPIKPGADLAGRIVRGMLALGHWVARAPGYRNIVYVEAMDADGAVNDDTPNRWNDLRGVLTIEKGKPVLRGLWQATTEPGTYYTQNGISDYAAKYGAARIAFGQYKAWRRGTHGDHVALVQEGELKVYRDKNKDYERTGDKLDVGAGFGINQHWGYDYPSDDIGRGSAGCLVGRTKKGHREFMQEVEADARYVANNGYLFISTILDGTTLPK